MILASDLLVYLYLSKGRNWRLGLYFPKRLLLHFCLSISIISKISQSQTSRVTARPFVSFASAKVKQSFHSTKSWAKLFCHHSRSKPCHSLLVRLTCDCKDTAIPAEFPNLSARFCALSQDEDPLRARTLTYRRWRKSPSDEYKSRWWGEETSHERGDINLYRSLGWPILRLLPRVLPSTYCAKASCTQLPNIRLRSDTQALRLIRAYSTYPAEEKASFSRRKKRLHVVVFPHLRT